MNLDKLLLILLQQADDGGDICLACSGLCEKYRARNNPGRLHYLSGQKRCQYCDLFIKTTKNRCPCCNFKLRLSPRELPRISTGSCRAGSIRHFAIIHAPENNQSSKGRATMVKGKLDNDTVCNK